MNHSRSIELLDLLGIRETLVFLAAAGSFGGDVGGGAGLAGGGGLFDGEGVLGLAVLLAVAAAVV